MRRSNWPDVYRLSPGMRLLSSEPSEFIRGR
jgi:hypothetical protein